MKSVTKILKVFSIIIPTYNRANFVKTAIDSVLQQTFREFEIIVVDDGSTDNTAAIIKEAYANQPLVRYHAQINRERGAARNAGVQLASGAYINFFDSDDYLLPNHLAVANEFILRTNPELFHLNYIVQNSEGTTIRRGPVGPGTANSALISGNILSLNGVMIRRDIAVQFPFNEERVLSAMEDWELWLRLAVHYPIHMIDQVTTVLVDHPGRSVLLTDKDALIARVGKLRELVLNNPAIVRYYPKRMAAFTSSSSTYVALHLALAGRYRKETISFLLQGIREDYKAIFTRRFLSIIKHLL